MKNVTQSHSIHYELTTERIRITRGVLSKKVEEIELTRVKDITVEQSLGQRALGIGNVILVSTDPTAPHLMLKDVSGPQKVKEKIRAAVRAEKDRRMVRYKEDI